VKYAFIESQAQNFPVEKMCLVLGVSKSGYYDWRVRGESKRALKRKKLLKEITNIHADSRGTYGSPRILRELNSKGQGVNHKTVESIMSAHGIRAKRSKKFKQTTDSRHNLPVAPNLLDREFSPRKPNLVWVSDITYIATEEGWLYLATYIDLFSRKVVGWSMSSRMTSDLVIDALKMGISRQKKAPLMVHSDRGSQYASWAFRNVLKENRCMRSMSKKGDCWDNAVAESFFGTLKTELVHHEKYKTREQARLSIFDYIETFYNKKRLHSHLNYLSPEMFEQSKGVA
jgi:putative transposase